MEPTIPGEPYEPAEPIEPAGQPALPRRSGRRALPFVLVSLVILASAIVSTLTLRGGNRQKPSGIQPTVVGVAEEAARPEGAPTPGDDLNLTVSPTPDAETAPEHADGALTLREIYRSAIDSVVCVQAAGSSGTSVGTGVLLSDDGYLITNYHVIENAVSCAILLSDDRQFEAALVGGDELTDLAVLKIEAEGLQPATFGDSDTLEVGDAVVAIGNPLGTKLRGTMTDGIVSAINRDITVDGREMTVIQTNAALNSGSSGGPLLNIYGQVVGINTAKLGVYAYEPVEGIGFAIPIASVKPIVDELIAQGYVSGRPSLGLTCESVPQYAQIYYRLPEGVFVTSIDERSDAWSKGIREGDILVELGGTRITSPEALSSALTALHAGDTVSATVYHAGAYYAIELTLGEQGSYGG